ncbi:MAG: endonuclease III [Syntrophomonadaceae bacterium]|nr:endonuclease III [Syntrophomonadaceae bacterium]
MPKSAASRPAAREIRKANAIIDILERAYPDARPMLDYRSPFECLTAVILSAQTTDEQVNRITPQLFARFPDADSMADAARDEVEDLIRSVGLYRSKAKNLQAMATMLREEFGSRVPQDFTALNSLPGVGRKTANVVQAAAWGIPGFGVDTHVARLCRRMGLIDSKNPEHIEKYMKSVLPPERWIIAHHALIFHGRRVCLAKKPGCDDCAVSELCDRKL